MKPLWFRFFIGGFGVFWMMLEAITFPLGYHPLLPEAIGYTSSRVDYLPFYVPLFFLAVEGFMVFVASTDWIEVL